MSTFDDMTGTVQGQSEGQYRDTQRARAMTAKIRAAEEAKQQVVQRDPLTEHARDCADLMGAMVMAMEAARNWYEKLRCARVMTTIHVEASLHRKELEHLMSDRVMPAGAVQGATLGGGLR